MFLKYLNYDNSDKIPFVILYMRLKSAIIILIIIIIMDDQKRNKPNNIAFYNK